MTSIKLGLRNLFRNRWRSALTLGAVAVAVGLMIWTLALYEGWIREMVRGATAVQTAQVQIHTAAYVDHPRVYYSFPADTSLYRKIEAVPRVVALAPRVKLTGLVGNERRSQVAQLLGVDPVREAQTTPIADAVVQGRWLSNEPAPYPAPREVVIGSGMARQLEVEPGDSLVTFLEAADGSLGNDLLVVVGIVETSNNQVDQMAVYLHLADAQYDGALDGQIHEIAIRTNDLTLAGQTATAVAQAIGGFRDGDTAASEASLAQTSPNGLLVQPWQEILPGVDQMILIFRRSYWILYLLVYVLAAAGILNTQRMSALERRREFGVIMAIGMRPRRMLRTLLVEAAVLGVVGAGIGCALGTALSWYHSVHGFDMGLLADQATFSYMGVAFSQRLFFVLRPSDVIEPVVIMVVVAVLSGLWPAFRAARIDPAPTIAGRT